MAIRPTHNRVSNAGAQRIGEALIEWAARQQICTCPWEEAIELIEFPRGQLKIRCMSCGRRIDVRETLTPDLLAERDALRKALKPFAALPVRNLLDSVPIYQREEAVVTAGDVRQARAALDAAGDERRE